jgi:cadmium resistance protein CadD (predicted permease)
VSSLPASAATAVVLFAGTNVDDLVVLALLSAASRAAGRPRRWEIWAGQYLGFAVLVGLSLIAGRGLSFLPAHWLWLLALIPLAIGIGTLAAAIRAACRGGQPSPPPHDQSAATGPSGASSLPGGASLPRVPGVSKVAGLSAVAGVIGVGMLTIVDGADDLAAYAPVFATAGGDRIAVTIAVFAVGVAVWCAAGTLLTRHHRITETLERYGRWILPAAFILIAVYILYATNAPIHL